MKDKIIKALECISGEEVCCEECSYSALYRYNFCIKRCAKDAIEQINRLKRQCDKYRNKVQGQAGELRRLYKQNAEQQAEIARLNTRNNELNALNKTASIDAIKDFAERLKASAYYADGIKNAIVDESDINDLVEEMVGDTK